MNLATRCNACGTIFRVVQDQLKVSEGWVRCGRCQAVFNAQQGLFDLDREAPPPWQPAAVEPETAEAHEPAPEAAVATPPEDAAASESMPDSDTDAPSISTTDSDRSTSPDAETGEVPVEVSVEPPGYTDVDGDPQPPSAAPETAPDTMSDAADAADSAMMSEARTAESDTDTPSIDSGAAPATVDAVPAPSDEAAPEPTPEFLRQAPDDPSREQGPMRNALVLAAVLAALVLVLQVTGHYRHRIAAQWPGTTPWLQSYCAFFQCRLNALQRIDDVSIESTALTQGDTSLQSDGGANALRLAVILRNRGEMAIAMPSVDLSLTGVDGEVVSRRSLSPADFRVSDTTLKPGVDAPLSVNFSVSGGRVSGYTVEVFYP